MTKEYRTKVFVYKKKDRGEANRIYTCFSEDFGKIDIYAKSIRKINSKLKSNIDLFYFSKIEFAEGRRNTLIDVTIIDKFSDIAKTPEKFTIAGKISKILDDFINGQEHDKEIFDLLLETFERLNNYSLLTTHYQLAYLYFIWNFFAILGYEPQLYKCAHCHNKLDENNLFFSYKEGGALCAICGALSQKINSDIIKIIRIILKQDWQTLQKIKINNEMYKDINNISKNYYLYLLPFRQKIWQ